MVARWQDVLEGWASWSVQQGDCIAWLNRLPADSIDLVVFSPPYEAARTYGIDFKLRGQEWVDWMVKVFEACRRVCKGLVACVCEGQTRSRRWSAVPALLMADLHRAGFTLRKPPAFHRIGIAGSGGKRADHGAAGGGADWLRNDYEFIVCTTRGGKLPWADGTACGHPPKWAPGGEMSHRLTNGFRCNQWGHAIDTGGTVQMEGGVVRSKGKRPSHIIINGRDQYGMSGGNRRRQGTGRREKTGRRCVRGSANGDTITSDSYHPPVLANPGNVIKCIVGGGVMGHKLAHENEAPYPLKLAEFFVRSFCPPGGLVLDCFAGSGTTLHAAILHGRRFVGCDVRQSQVEIARRRGHSVTPLMMASRSLLVGRPRQRAWPVHDVPADVMRLRLAGNGRGT